MTDVASFDNLINVTIKRKSKKKAGFEVERRDDGFYYIIKVPKNCTKIGVGDRVLEINGTMHENFKNQMNANDLVDSFRLEVVPVDDDEDEGDDSEEEYEESNRSRSKKHSVPRAATMASSKVNGSSRSKNVEIHSEVNEDDNDHEKDWNDSGEMESEEPNWDGETSDNRNNNNSVARAAAKRNEPVDKEKLAKDKKSWDRKYVSQYEPDERFMITVTKGEGQHDDDLGIDLVEFQESEIYVSEVDRGPFYDTALNRGDRIISINGNKIPDDLDTVDEAMDILESKSQLTLFVFRPSEEDEGYKWVLANT